MDKAIDTLEFLIEYLHNEVHPNCEYYIYSNLVDIADKALAELTAHKAKIDELKEWATTTYNYFDKIIDNAPATVKTDFEEGVKIICKDILQKIKGEKC